MIEIKPCPFPGCGSDNAVVQNFDLGVHHRIKRNKYYVCCDCGAEGPKKPTPETAIELAVAIIDPRP